MGGIWNDYCVARALSPSYRSIISVICLVRELVAHVAIEYSNRLLSVAPRGTRPWHGHCFFVPLAMTPARSIARRACSARKR